MQERNLNCCEIIIFLQDDNGNPQMDVVKLNTILVKQACRIKAFAYIVHNQDHYTASDEAVNPAHRAGDTIPAHIHLFLQFNRSYFQRYTTVFSWFDAPIYLYKVGFSWEESLLRLTQQDTPWNYQYSASEITANFDILPLLNQAMDRKRLEYLMMLILCGDPESIIPEKLVSYLSNRFLIKMRSYFESTEGKADFNEWLQSQSIPGIVCPFGARCTTDG